MSITPHTVERITVSHAPALTQLTEAPRVARLAGAEQAVRGRLALAVAAAGSRRRRRRQVTGSGRRIVVRRRAAICWLRGRKWEENSEISSTPK